MSEQKIWEQANLVASELAKKGLRVAVITLYEKPEQGNKAMAFVSHRLVIGGDDWSRLGVLDRSHNLTLIKDEGQSELTREHLQGAFTVSLQMISQMSKEAVQALCAAHENKHVRFTAPVKAKKQTPARQPAPATS